MTTKTLLSHRKTEPEIGVLYLVGTPIGNLSDISSRALNILNNVFLIACEDTRQTRKIINKHDIKTKLTSFNKHNFLKKIPQIITHLKSEKSIALVSDAGMPSICDPGEQLVKMLKREDLEVICIPGACAATTALVTSGFPSSKFIFEGFLPKKLKEREEIFHEMSTSEKTRIIYESPHRIKKTLKELKDFCGGQREILVARELTKKFEEHIGPNIDGAIDHFRSREIIGEFTIVIKGCEIKKDRGINISKLKKELHSLVKAGLSLSSAAKHIANRENISKNTIYNLY